MKTCRQVMEEVTYKNDLNLFEKLSLRFHLFICKKCKKIDQQIIIMDENLSLLLKQELAHDKAAIDRIKENLIEKFSA